MATKWNGKSVYQLEQKRQKVTALDAAMGAVRAARNEAHEAFMVELGLIIERNPQDLQLGHWECEGSPTKRCIYDMSTDERDDVCLFCEHPSERK